VKILITRPREQADPFAAALRAAGFEPVFFPVIEIRLVEDTTALDRALGKLDCYDWIVFTSANGAAIVCERMQALEASSSPAAQPKIAAIGPKTAEALTGFGLTPAFVPGEYVAEAILPGLGDLRGRWVLLPRAEIARKALPEAIAAAGGIAHEIAVYRTLPAEPDPAGIAALQAGVDWLTFTSPSTVHHFVEIARRLELDPLSLPGNPQTACIGPITAAAAREAGFPVAVVAGEYTTAGLIEAILDFRLQISD
jgi:uroporphyrinogen-III synthase